MALYLAGYSSLIRRYAIALTLTLITFVVLFNKGPDLETLRDYAQLDAGYKTSGWVSQRQFIRRALEDDIYAKPYNGSAVRALCSQTEWREGLVISCDEIAGGIGNLKARLLGCTRYAIEAGAMLLHPVIHPRSAFDKMDKSFAWDVDLPLDYAFDSDHYYKTLAKDCPQLRFVNESQAFPPIPPKNESFRISPTALTATAMDGHLVTEPEAWRASLDRWIAGSILQPTGQAALDAARPVRISLDEWVQFTWPTAHDGLSFRNDWGHLARFPARIRELSMRLLYRLFDRLGCWPQDPATVASASCFLGAHVRTEADAQVEGWASYETQLLHVREQLDEYQLPALYVATGTPSDVDRLRRDLADVRVAPGNGTSSSSSSSSELVGVQVLQKWDLLEDDDMMLMDTLTWDQMALIDLDIMLRASRFEGIWESSWTWMIALKRNEQSTAEGDPYEQGTTFEDGLSRIYGPPHWQPFIRPTIYL